MDALIPIRGIQHVGLTVPDMEEAVRFFETVFGAITVMNLGEVDLDDEFLEKRLGVPAGRRMKDQRVITCGKGGNIELFEYAGEHPSSPTKHNSIVGAFHIAFQVDDVWAAADRLRASGVDVLDGPTLIESGLMAGLTWLYLRAPWGLYLELVSMDSPLGYEAQGGPKMWSLSE